MSVDCSATRKRFYINIQKLGETRLLLARYVNVSE